MQLLPADVTDEAPLKPAARNSKERHRDFRARARMKKLLLADVTDEAPVKSAARNSTVRARESRARRKNGSRGLGNAMNASRTCGNGGEIYRAKVSSNAMQNMRREDLSGTNYIFVDVNGQFAEDKSPQKDSLAIHHSVSSSKSASPITAVLESSRMPTNSDSATMESPKPSNSMSEFQRTILLEFKKLHDKMDKLREEILPELRQLNQRVMRLENHGKSQNSSMPCRPACLPIKSDHDLEMFEQLSDDEYDDTVRYFEFVTGFNVKETVNNIIKEAIQDQYSMDLTWHGKNDKKSFINTRLSKAIFEAVSKSKFYERPNSKEFQCAVTEALRNSKQRVRNKKESNSAAQESRKRPYVKIKEEFGGES